MRGPPVCLRAATAEEASAVESLARSRTASARRVERARIVWRASRGETAPAIAAAPGLSAETVCRRIRRFNAEGLAALDDHRRSRIDEILLREGLRWRRREAWFGERVDPEFAEKRPHGDALHSAAARQRSGLPR